MNYKHKLLYVGESLNASIPKIKEAVTNHDEETVKALAVRQEECGAHMLDLNAAVSGQNEVEDLAWIPLHYQQDVYAALKASGLKFTPRPDRWIVVKEIKK